MRRAIAIALFTLLGCDGDEPEVTQPRVIAGTYALTAVGGAPLPAPYFRGVAITSGRLTILPDGTWTETRSSVAVGSVLIQNTTYYGTWTETGSHVAFYVASTRFYTGVRTSSGLGLDSGGTVYTYSRE
jgi:hypothetical protein